VKLEMLETLELRKELRGGIVSRSASRWKVDSCCRLLSWSGRDLSVAE